MSIRSQVTFTTDFFKPVADEDDKTNPGRHGKALALWLAERLKEGAVSVESVIPEDFGWVVIVSRKPLLLWLGCGNTDGSTSEWSVVIVAEEPALQRIFKRTGSRLEFEKLKDHLSAFVSSIPGIKNIVWE